MAPEVVADMLATTCLHASSAALSTSPAAPSDAAPTALIPARDCEGGSVAGTSLAAPATLLPTAVAALLMLLHTPSVTASVVPAAPLSLLALASVLGPTCGQGEGRVVSGEW